MEELGNLALFYNSSVHVERDEFAIFARSLLSNHPSMDALSWNPRVRLDDRARFEQSIRDEGLPEFQITEREQQGRMVRAGDRDEYFPVTYIEPVKGNEAAFGFDLASSSSRLKALLEARDSGKKHTTERITLVQEAGDHIAVIGFGPVYQNSAPDISVEMRRETLTGYFSAVFRVDHIVEKSLESIEPKGIDIHLFDLSAPVEKQFLAFHSSRLRAEPAKAIKNSAELLRASHQYSETFDVAGREWMVVITPAPELLAKFQSWTPLISLSVSMLFVTLLILHLIVLLKRSEKDRQFTHELEYQVAERTASLAAANTQLAQSSMGMRLQSEITKNMDEGIALVRISNGKIFFANEKFEQLFGYGHDELTEKDISIINAPTDRSPEEVAEVIMQELHEQGSWHGEVKNIKKDGAIIWTSASVTTFEHDDEGTLWLIVQRDITRRKQSEMELKSSEIRLQSILDNTSTVIYLKDLEGKYLLTNNQWTKLFGITPEDMVGKTDYDVFPEEMADAFRKNDLKVLKENRIMELEEYAPHDDGVHTYISIKFPLSDEDGNQYGVGGISTDITDRANSEHLLQEIRDRHEEAQRVAQLGHWELDLIKDELIWSKEECHIYGTETGATNTYELFLEGVHPDDRDYVNGAFTDSVENRTQYDIEHRLLMQDGTIKWVHECCKTFYAEDGTPLRAIGTTQDITERKLASLERKESEARLSSILEMAADAIISIDEEQKVVLFNKAAEKMFGYTQLDVLGEHVSQLMPERYRQGHLGKVETFLANDSIDSINRNRGMFGLRSSGEEFQMETTISKQTLSDNRTLMTVMIRDIHDQLNAEEAQRKLSQAVKEAGEAIVITNRDAVIEYINPAFTKITGYEPEELIGKTPAILKSTAQDPVFYKELWETITRGDVWHGTLIDKKKDGSFYPAMMSVAPIHNDEGEITHYVSLQQDVTEYKRLEQQFLQAQKMESIGTLVGGIAHDFNNILAAVLGNIHLARVKKSDPEVVDTKLENVEKLSNRAAEMIRQLLTFSRNDMVELKKIPLTPFVKEGFKLAKSAIKENIECVLDVCSENLTVVADATQLQQVIMNLLNNARDAVADAKKPKISCSLQAFEATDSFVEKHPDFNGRTLAKITISDNGCGIQEEHLNKVFEPFFTTKGVGEGTGLGLSMVFGAIQNYGGIVEVESQVGKGTSFHLYLPVEEEKPGPVDQEETTISQGDGELLLLVDDEDDIRYTTQELLNSLGYETLEAADGKKALEIYSANRERVGLVISDVVMPKMGGVDLMKAVHQLDDKVPFIFMTGYDMGHLLESEELETNRIISKPFTVEKLSKMIHQVLKGDEASPG